MVKVCARTAKKKKIYVHGTRAECMDEKGVYKGG